MGSYKRHSTGHSDTPVGPGDRPRQTRSPLRPNLYATPTVHSDRLASPIGDGSFHGKARVLPSAQAGLLPIGQGIDVGVNTRVGSVGHAGSTVT